MKSIWGRVQIFKSYALSGSVEPQLRAIPNTAGHQNGKERKNPRGQTGCDEGTVGDNAHTCGVNLGVWRGFADLSAKSRLATAIGD